MLACFGKEKHLSAVNTEKLTKVASNVKIISFVFSVLSSLLILSVHQ